MYELVKCVLPESMWEKYCWSLQLSQPFKYHFNHNTLESPGKYVVISSLYKIQKLFVHYLEKQQSN